MPTYEYFCPNNHQTVEVLHGMSECLTTWGEVCERAELACPDEESAWPVEKLLGAGLVIERSSTPSGPEGCGPEGCGPEGGGCCMGGACGRF